MALSKVSPQLYAGMIVDIELFIKVIEGLTIYNYEGQKIFEYEILKQKNVAKK